MERKEQEIADLFTDTTEFIKRQKVAELSAFATAYKQAKSLTENVEFWNWLGRNYPNQFGTAELARQTAINKPTFSQLQVQGKGYEWDWMLEQQKNIRNLFAKFTGGDNPIQAGIDITKINMLTGNQATYQHKAYMSSNPLNLSNTPSDAIVVTNEENVMQAIDKGYSAAKYQNSNTVRKTTDKRLQQARKGKAAGTYGLENVGLTMAKAGLIGCVVGVSVETISLYKDWKSGAIANEHYLKSIAVAGSHAGTTAALTSAVMIPIQSTVLVAGVSTLITIPIVFIMGGAFNKIVAPCFARGEYQRILSSIRYYTNLETAYGNFIDCALQSANEYERFAGEIVLQSNDFKDIKKEDATTNNQLSDLYKLI